jgi:uncharacterized protein involved in exopolysaccharide biosynthesis
MAATTLLTDPDAPRQPQAGAFDPAGVSGREDEISLVDLAIALAGHKRLILSITGGFAILAIAVSLVWPASYTATLTLLPPQQNSSLSSQLAAQLGSLGGLAQMAGGGALIKNPNEMFVAMLTSRTVEDAMVDRFGLMQEYHSRYRSDARKAFANHVKVDGSGKDGLIHIAVQDHDPQRAAALANGYVDQFRALERNLALTEAQQRRLFFEEQWKLANQNLAAAEEALKETEERTGLIQIDSQARALIEAAAALRAQITAKEVQIQGIATYASGGNAQLIEAEQELASLRAQLARLGGTSQNPENILVPKGQMTSAGVEYVRRLRDVKYYETIYEILARQYELAKLDEAKEGAIVQVVDPAVAPERRSSPKRGLIVLAATAAGFMVGIACALLAAALRRAARDPEARAKLELLRRSL